VIRKTLFVVMHKDGIYNYSNSIYILQEFDQHTYFDGTPFPFRQLWFKS